MTMKADDEKFSGVCREIYHAFGMHALEQDFTRHGFVDFALEQYPGRLRKCTEQMARLALGSQFDALKRKDPAHNPPAETSPADAPQQLMLNAIPIPPNYVLPSSEGGRNYLKPGHRATVAEIKMALAGKYENRRYVEDSIKNDERLIQAILDASHGDESWCAQDVIDGRQPAAKRRRKRTAQNQALA